MDRQTKLGLAIWASLFIVFCFGLNFPEVVFLYKAFTLACVGIVLLGALIVLHREYVFPAMLSGLFWLIDWYSDLMVKHEAEKFVKEFLENEAKRKR